VLRKFLLVGVVAGAPLWGCLAVQAQEDKPQVREADAQHEQDWAYSVGVQNYVFGLPLIIYERERETRLDPEKLEKARKFAPAAPLNQIGHMMTLARADDIMPYTPNNDTVYSGALLELADQPIILSAPDILDRYWSVEVADAYTNNLFYIGTRATDGKGGAHAFVGPNWKGTLPEGVVEHRVPTNSVMFAVRLAVMPGDKDDLAKVNALQKEFQLTSLSNWADPVKHGQAAIPKLAPRPDYHGDLAFYESLADLLTENPPPPDHEAAVVLLGRGGIHIGETFDAAALDEPTRKGLMQAAADGPEIMKWKVKYRGTPYPTRWNNLRPGTYGFDYFDRAAGALEGRSSTTERRPSTSALMRMETAICSTAQIATSSTSPKMKSRRRSRTASGRSPCTEQTFSS
jgi:hypothetical protein